jgi:hypothetical protein
MFSRSTVASVAVFCLLVGLLACSKVSELVDKTKAKVSSGADQIKEGVSSAADRAKEQLNLRHRVAMQHLLLWVTSGRMFCNCAVMLPLPRSPSRRCSCALRLELLARANWSVKRLRLRCLFKLLPIHRCTTVRSEVPFNSKSFRSMKTQ